MIPGMIALSLLPPLMIFVGIVIPGLGSLARKLAPFAAIPALIASIFAKEGSIELSGFLFGSKLGLDLSGRVFLGLAAVLWACAGIFSARYFKGERNETRFLVFFLLAMEGNLGLAFSLDAGSFYFFFALMTFASYGLVVHKMDEHARFAARTYMFLAVLGEMLILSGLWMGTFAAGSAHAQEISSDLIHSPYRDLTIGCLLFGFGVKAGLAPLHMWLPLAHPAAPVPASAVLSGIMIKAGALGWLRFLPLGFFLSPEWGAVAIGAGFLMAFGGVVIGATQEESKAVLAYSSISQMGFVTMALGTVFLNPEAHSIALVAILVFFVHHGFAKAALFMGVGLIDRASGRARNAALIALLFSALALAGAPLSSGAVAKSAIKGTLAFAPGDWPLWIDWLLPATGVGTTVLMGRFLHLISLRKAARAQPIDLWLWSGWAALLMGVFLALWMAPVIYGLELERAWLPAIDNIFYVSWPLVLGFVLLWRIGWLRRHPQSEPLIRPGDLIVAIISLFRRAGSVLQRKILFRLDQGPAAFPRRFPLPHFEFLGRAERSLWPWPVAGSSLCLIVFAIWLFLWRWP